MTAILAVVVNVFIVVLGHLHIRSMTDLDPYVDSVSSVSEVIYANRGNIYDINGEIVAQDIQTYDIICYLDKNRSSNKNVVAYVDDPLYASQVLATILDMDQATVYDYLTPSTYHYQVELGPKGRNLSEETMREILNYPNLHGIGFRTSYKRFYPKGEDFSPYILGYARSDDTGRLVGEMGVEQLLDEELSGTDGYHAFQRDKHGYILPGMYEEITEAENGYDVYLTIDASIQDALETSFDDVRENNNAIQAWGAVVEISSGKILAWGQTPSFDPNTLEVEDWNNYGSMIAYEPGSVMKSFIYAAAMDMGVYNGTDTFNSEPYCYLAGSGNAPYRSYGANLGCIHNSADKNWGNIELDYGLIYSSNVATSTLLSDYVGPENFVQYLEKFGFFKPVNVYGMQDVSGYLNYTYPSEKLSLTFGQGSSATTLQLLQGYSAIFGNGEMVKPYIIDKIVDRDHNEIVYEGEREVVSQPISEEAAKQMQDLLRRVVSDKGGTARFYSVDEVDIMAKTGTSEIATTFGYTSDYSIQSIMMGFPYEDPQYMVYYAYISPYDLQNHTNSRAITDFVKRVAILTNVGYNPDATIGEDTIKKYEMPSLSGLSVSEAEAIVNDMGGDLVLIGNGLNVVKQFPESGSAVYTNDKVFLLTDSENIALPDMRGWSRKEVIEYWKLSGIPFAIDGYGVVIDQSLPAGTSVDGNSEVAVAMGVIETDIDLSKKPLEDGEE
ncbi:MAG: penicillin-binding protein [Erysipelotrichaceae bacterium]|nr:penicillin-binding protein [Erysipelotrichaceae bacterium]